MQPKLGRKLEEPSIVACTGKLIEVRAHALASMLPPQVWR
jgi:hypothetical protein